MALGAQRDSDMSRKIENVEGPRNLNHGLVFGRNGTGFRKRRRRRMVFSSGMPMGRKRWKENKKAHLGGGEGIRQLLKMWWYGIRQMKVGLIKK